MLYLTLHFFGSFCNTKNTSIKFYLVIVSKSLTNYDRWSIALSLSESEWSFKIVSNAENIYSFESYGPIILLI